MTENALTPKENLYCLHRHSGLSQRAAWRRANPDSTAGDATVDVKACQLEAQDKISIRLVSWPTGPISIAAAKWKAACSNSMTQAQTSPAIQPNLVSQH